MREAIYDTTFMQLYSVVRFAKQLGFSWDGRTFSKEGGLVKYARMQEYHNGHLIYTSTVHKVIFITNQPLLRFTKQEYDIACSQKIVEDSYVQWSKKQSKWTTDKHIVRLL